MNTLAICLSAAVLGTINAGWERREGGGMEYVIQLDADDIDTMRRGQPLGSDIPPVAGEVRSYRIEMSTGRLRHDIPPAPPRLAPDPASKPLGEQRASFLDTKEKAAPRNPPRAVGPPPDVAPPAVSPPEPAKPWLPLSAALLGLFGSLSANVYLGWLAWGYRQRCRRAVAAK